ncbi:MAG: PDDEXK nuclease domain-containing protein [Candidatus Cloacimonadales bacterium]|nr:PDDEXK nuclease domain-containing protein [Candidatus Cloacimonadales bacterium]
MNDISVKEDFFNSVVKLIEQAKKNVAVAINQEMIFLYWNIGKSIKEEIIKSDRAEYGKQVVNSLSAHLTDRYGRGYSTSNLWYMIQLYENYQTVQSLIGEFEGLTWTHIIQLLPIKEELKRKFYATFCLKERWSTRILQNRIGSLLYERTALSKLPEKTIENQLKELKEEDKMTSDLVFRDPYVLDFLQLSDSYSEKDLESAILNALQKFILEFGKDFYFVERQKRITLDAIDFYMDLVFYHRRLKCFIVIELKLDKFRPEYKGQMELYLKYLKKYEKLDDENPPIGLILCSEKGQEQMELMFLQDDRIKVAEYITELPPKELFLEKLHEAIQIAQVQMKKNEDE